MSDEAYRIYAEALSEQHSRNEARRIRIRVNEARQSPHSAAIRWPFELLQNALDAGPRNGRRDVTIRLRREPEKVVFEHDGAPFTSEELAALLSGGSSKEYESETTTGRFGTGFLVTHVLAEQTRLRGLLQLAAGFEAFDLMLDRAGDEEAILDNIRQSHEAIRSAVPVQDLDVTQSAVIEYACSDGDVWTPGLEELRRALPYLYGTCRNLGYVEVQTGEGRIEQWEPSKLNRTEIDGGCVESRTIEVTGNDLPRRELRVYRFEAAAGASAAALALVEQTSSGQRVCLPETNAPRIFREYPLRSSGFVPVNLILDGKFEPEQERSGLLMSEEDRALLEQAMSAAVLAVQYAIDQEWKDGHWLARAWPPEGTFHATDAEELEWWIECLAGFACRLAALSIVDCGSQFLPATNPDGASADFIYPRIHESLGADETSVDRLWPLVEATDEMLPPRKELAQHWTTIAEGWHSLGLRIEPICVAKLAEWVREDAKTLDQLKVMGDAQRWLAELLDIVGECWDNRGGTDVSPLMGLMPNQNRRLCSPSELKRDQGISERLKDICTEMGNDIRDELLLSGFEDIASTRKLCHLGRVLAAAIPTDGTEDDVVSDTVKHLSERLPEDKGCDDTALPVQKASVRFLAHLWESGGKTTASVAREVPLVASNRRSVRWSADRLFMAPVRTWPDSAQSFSDAYPPNRVLDGLYAGSETDGIPSVAAALVEWEIALGDPVTTETLELRDRRLEALALSDVDTNGIVVHEQRMSQIALLQPEVLNRCQEGVEEARALLGLVLCHVAPCDSGWKEQRVARGRKSKEEIEVQIGGALWLADLKVRAWVPVPGEDGKPAKVVATAATLKHLLDSRWLQDNDDGIRLLSECFGFDQLELRLMSITEDLEQQRELRDSLAGLVETGGADPELYTALAEEVEVRRQRSRDVEQCRSLGLAVQEAIGAALQGHDLEVTLVDRGFDFEVASVRDDVVEDFGNAIEIGPYLVEVKATKTGKPRLTPTQAAVASQKQARYVLCVVDLRDAPDSDFERAWTAERVEPQAKLVPDIGGRVEETYGWVELATELDVSIRNESALRYEVPPEIWESGMSIAAWVKASRATLLDPVVPKGV